MNSTTNPIFSTEVHDDHNDEVVLTLRIPKQVIDEHTHDLTLYAEFDKTAGISLDVGAAWTDDQTEILHPESNPVVLMRYAFLLALLGQGRPAEVIDFKSISREI